MKCELKRAKGTTGQHKKGWKIVMLALAIIGTILVVALGVSLLGNAGLEAMLMSIKTWAGATFTAFGGIGESMLATILLSF